MNNDTDFRFGSNAEEEPKQESPFGECMQRIICPRCGRFHGYCDAVTEQTKQIGGSMLPGQDSGDGGRGGRGGNRKSNKLTVEDLSVQPREAKILAVKASDGQFGPQVVVKLSVNGESKFWYVSTKKDKNPNYGLLLARFGRDENEWAGQKILLASELDDFTDNYYIRVSFPEKEAKRTR